MKLQSIVAFAALLATTSPRAQSLEEKAAWKKAEAKIAEYALGANKTCQSAITFEVDKASVGDAAKAANFMWSATEAFDSTCRNVDGAKEAVAAKVKTVRLLKGPATRFELKGTTLNYTSTLEGGTGDPRDALVAWLPKHL